MKIIKQEKLNEVRKGTNRENEKQKNWETKKKVRERKAGGEVRKSLSHTKTDHLSFST